MSGLVFNYNYMSYLYTIETGAYNFVESIRRTPVSTMWTFDKMTLQQKAFSTNWFSRQSVVGRNVVYPSLSTKKQITNFSSANLIFKNC